MGEDHFQNGRLSGLGKNLYPIYVRWTPLNWMLLLNTVKSRNYESRNNELSRYNEVGHGDAVMQVSIEKSRYNEVKAADRGPS